MKKLIGLGMFLLLGCDYMDNILQARVPLNEDSATGNYGRDRKDHPDCYSNITLKEGGFCSTGFVCSYMWVQFQCTWERDKDNQSIIHVKSHSPNFSTDWNIQPDAAYDLTLTGDSVINSDGLEFKRKGPS